MEGVNNQTLSICLLTLEKESFGPPKYLALFLLPCSFSDCSMVILASPSMREVMRRGTAFLTACPISGETMLRRKWTIPIMREINSLQATLSSLNDLKKKNGAVGDFVTLHDKILEIETQLQILGVDLGNFNTENEFCTLHFSL